MRIASLLASGTEITALLGKADDLVGISHECDYPSSIRHLPVLTRSHINFHSRSDLIHLEVQERVRLALSLYEVNNPLVAELAPDVIITQEQCDVCAVTFDDVREAVCTLLQKDVKIVSLNPTSLSEIFEDVRRVAGAVGANADGVLESMNKNILDVQHKVAAITKKPRVAFIEWIDPIFIGANWMPELIALAGGVPLFGESGRKSHVISIEELLIQNPDVIVIAPCGFKLPQTKADLHLLTSKPLWRELDAVKANRVFLCDGNSYFNRSSPRLMESLELLAGVIHLETHPNLFETELKHYRQNEMWEELL
jgi:iron complex transport system substrate-binding protein